MRSAGLIPNDFKQLPKDGARFEALTCQLLEAMGFRILEKPAVGTEGGRDVLVERTLKDVMGERSERVVVQCKHYAHSGKAIGDTDVGVWQNAMTRSRAHGYLLVTDTRVTENLSKSFREFTATESQTGSWANFWDVDQVISLLNKYPEIRDSFLTPANSTSTPLAELAHEVRTWLESIRYQVSDLDSPNPRIVDMVALLEQGTIKQRILARCVGGEIGIADVKQMEGELNRQGLQGWLVSDRRVSIQARERAKEIDNLDVYNLPELLHSMIWGPYFDTLTELVMRDRISDFYVDLQCYKLRAEDDDEANANPRETHSSLDSYIDEWLSERGKMHISLLGEFGAGKTWFCRHYAQRQLVRFLNNPVKERLPLLITLRMFSKATTAQQLINDALLEQYRLPFVGSAYEVFQRLNLNGKLLLILDGFDEMARKVDYQTVVDNFWELAKLVEDESKVILTSRAEYFRWAKESEKILAGEEFGRRTIVLQPPNFEVVYLEPFSDEQIKDVILKRMGTDDGTLVYDKVMATDNLAEMARKPVLLELLLVALTEVNPAALDNPTQVYLYATNKLLLRNIAAEKTFTSTADKVYFLCELAAEMIETGQLRMHYTAIPDRIKTYFGDRIKDQHELDMWDYDLRAQTLLHRDAAGYYEFAHKSLAEYFVALKFAAQLSCLDQTFIDTYFDDDTSFTKLLTASTPVKKSEVLLPKVNYEIARFFADMAGEQLSKNLPALKRSSTQIAQRFRRVKRHLLEQVEVPKPIDDTSLAQAAFTAFFAAWPESVGGISVLFADEIVSMFSTQTTGAPTRIRIGKDTSRYSGLQKPSVVEEFGSSLGIFSSRFKTRSLLTMPLSYNARSIGMCYLMTTKAIESDSDDIDRVMIFCMDLAEYLVLLGRFRESWQTMPPNDRYILVWGLTVELAT